MTGQEPQEEYFFFMNLPRCPCYNWEMEKKGKVRRISCLPWVLLLQEDLVLLGLEMCCSFMSYLEVTQVSLNSTKHLGFPNVTFPTAELLFSNAIQENAQGVIKNEIVKLPLGEKKII